MRVDGTGFGWISVSGRRYDHDVVVRGEGVHRRRKELSSHRREVHGHTPLTWEELRTYLGGTLPEVVVIGTGQYGAMPVEGLDELRAAVRRVVVRPTPEAAEEFNRAVERGEDALGVFHVTC